MNYNYGMISGDSAQKCASARLAQYVPLNSPIVVEPVKVHLIKLYFPPSIAYCIGHGVSPGLLHGIGAIELDSRVISELAVCCCVLEL